MDYYVQFYGTDIKVVYIRDFGWIVHNERSMYVLGDWYEMVTGMFVN